MREQSATFDDWRQHCLHDALDFIDKVLFDGSARTQPGLRPAWQEQLRSALTQPRQTSVESDLGGLTLDTLSGVTLLSDDEVSQSVVSRRIVQALDGEAEWTLRELGALTLPWQREAEFVGFETPVLLEPARLTETLDRALNGCVPHPPRRVELLSELQRSMVREASAMYRRQVDWLEQRGVNASTDPRRVPTGAPAPHGVGVPTPSGATAPLPIGADQWQALLEQLEHQDGLSDGMRSVFAEVGRLTQRSVQADAGLVRQSDQPLWRFVDRLVGLAQFDTASGADDASTLHQRIAPLVDAMKRAPQPMQARHYEQALAHLERIASSALSAAGAQQSPALAQAMRRAELQPLVQAQIAEQVRRLDLLAPVRQFLLGAWTRVVTHASAADGIDSPAAQRWTRLIESLMDGANLRRRQPLSPAALECLLLEAHDGLVALGEAPARIERELDTLRTSLQTWPRQPAETVPPAGSTDVLASDWAHHGDLATVPVPMVDLPDSPAHRDLARWIDGLKAGDLCRTSLQGRWTTVRLDWIGEQGGSYAFSRRTGAPFCASRRVLERMRSEGLITTIPAGQWLRDAVNRLPGPRA